MHFFRSNYILFKFYSFKKVSPRSLSIAGLLLFLLLFGMEGRLLIQKRALAPHRVVESTIQIIDDIQSLLNKMLDAKLAQNDFLYTGDTDLLYLYTTAVGAPPMVQIPEKAVQTDKRTISQIFEDIHVLEKSDVLTDNRNLDKLETLVRQEFDYIGRAIDEQRKERKKVKDINEDDKMMADIRATIAITINEERTGLMRIMRADEQSGQRLDDSIVGVTLTSNAILLAAVLLIIGVFLRVRRAERDLSAKEAHFRAAAEGMLDAFFIFHAKRGEDGTVQNLALQHLNPAAECMLNAKTDEVVGKFVESVLPASTDKKDIRQACMEVLKNALPQESEYVAISGATSGRSFQQQIIPLPDGVAVTCRDITERKKVERMKNEFVSTVSHELRTPLTSIRGSLGLITGGVAGPISDQVKNLLTIAYNNCERLVRLINDILDIEKMESGGMVFQLRAVPLLPLVRQVIDANQAFAEKFHINVALEATAPCIWSDDVMVTADSDRLTQALTNLLSNAIKFSHDGGRVTLRCREEGEHVRIEVVDNGSGIPKEFQSRIFGKFAQADSSDTRQKGGTGLGLNIVKKIVEEMKGTIGFDTQEGKGTTFYFTIPLVLQKNTASSTISSDNHDVVRHRILVCEDEPDIAHLLTLILERAGFKVDAAQSAAAAVALLNKRSYLAMTLDLALPDKDGITLIHDLRADKRFENLPIIVVSVKAEEGRQQIGGDAFGIVDWLKKPIDMDRLVGIVQGIYAASHKPRILHIEDDLDIVEILRLSLQDLSEFVHATTLSEAKKYLSSEIFDLVILDVNLPDGKGTDLLPLMVDKSGKSVPVILFTAIEVAQEVGAMVAASLTKSRTSEQQLLDTIKKIISEGQTAKEKVKGQSA
jgi:signal transduction histidine kinase/DNA-binding response OmpR family regulator